MAETLRRKLGWIELGRGIAATAVALSHSSLADTPEGVNGLLVPLGPWGVAFFFVLSGFIIFHVHEDDLGNPVLSANFVWRRFLRIFPTYWLVLILDVGLRSLGRTEGRPSITSTFLIDQIGILPGAAPFISVAWTLRHELLFYSFFVIAILNLRTGITLFALWFAAIVFCSFQAGPLEARPQRFIEILTSRLDLYFFLGMLVAFALRRGFVHIIAIVTAVAGISLYLSSPWIDRVMIDTIFQMMVCTAVVCICIQLSGSVSSPKIFLWIGAVSYPLYLINETAFYIVGGLLKRAAPIELQNSWQLKIAVALILSFALATLISSGFEKALTSLRLPRLFKPSILPSNADARH
jgi:peptidoglycan/LPS O-acetylase OafA/YrhL